MVHFNEFLLKNTTNTHTKKPKKQTKPNQKKPTKKKHKERNKNIPHYIKILKWMAVLNWVHNKKDYE